MQRRARLADRVRTHGRRHVHVPGEHHARGDDDDREEDQHDAGDAVLRTMGEILRNATRESELAFRYGGEEFLLLIPYLDDMQATARAEAIRAEIAALRIRHDGRALGPITASIGLASAPLHCAFHDLVRTADAALLRAKESGRDRLVIAENRRAEQRAA